MEQIYDTTGVPIMVWATDLEEEALKQATNLAVLPFAFHHVSVMADGHSGYGMPIGGVFASDGCIIPSAIGYDIGCGVRAVKTSLKHITVSMLKKILGSLRDKIPIGPNHHEKAQEWEEFDKAPNVDIVKQQLDSARKQLCTLGSGK